MPFASHAQPAGGRSVDERRSAVLESARRTMRHQGEGLKVAADAIDDSFLEVVQTLQETTGKVFVTGAGTSAAIGRRMAHLLSVSGTPSMFIPAGDALHGTMAAITPDDSLIAISKGGASSEINQLVEIVRERGIDTVIALTSAPEARLAQLSDIVVELTNIEGIDPGEVIAMGSTLVTASWGDALAVVLMRMTGYAWSQVLQSHPSGAVGALHEEPAPLEPLEPFWNRGE